MKKIYEIYKNLLEDIGLRIENDKVYLDETEVQINKKPLMLPTYKSCSTYGHFDKLAGKQVLSHWVFNPMEETTSDDSNPSLDRLRYFMEANINTQLKIVGGLLLEAIMFTNNGGRKNISNDILSFGATVESLGGKIDDKVLKRWHGYMDAIAEDNVEEIVSLVTTPYIVIDGKTYKSGLVIDSNFIDRVNEDQANGVVPSPMAKSNVLRKSDLPTFKTLVDFMLNMDLTVNNVASKTEDAYSPSYVVLLDGYSIITKRLNGLLKDMKFLDNDIVEEVIMPEIDVGYLDEIENLYKEFKSSSMPTYSELNYLAGKASLQVTANISEVEAQQPSPQHKVEPWTPGNTTGHTVTGTVRHTPPAPKPATVPQRPVVREPQTMVNRPVAQSQVRSSRGKTLREMMGNAEPQNHSTQVQQTSQYTGGYVDNSKPSYEVNSYYPPQTNNQPPVTYGQSAPQYRYQEPQVQMQQQGYPVQQTYQQQRYQDPQMQMGGHGQQMSRW